MSKKAIIAMSGGVDSSVAAYLMKNEGYECIGATMKLHRSNDSGDTLDVEEGSCCSTKDIEDAKQVANSMGMEHHVFDFTGNFEKEVIERFVNTYIEGGTPNPCVDCNRRMKFAKMMDKMYEYGFDYVVTGHYARIDKDETSGRYILKKGLDESKDQSYVLYNMTQEQLAHTMFPLGKFSKEEIRNIAKEQKLIVADKSDSQDICFVPDGDYARFIEEYCGQKFPEGDFVTEDGKVLGRHKGIIRYTIGQRKGLGLSLPAPLYVCEKNVAENTVVLASNEKLFKSTLEATDMNWISIEEINEPIQCKAKIRYKQREADAIVEKVSADKVKITFKEPQRGITKGQAVVLYDDDIVIGGGRIL